MTAVVRLFYLYSSLLNVADEAHSHRQRREMVGCYLYESLDGHLLSFATRLYHHGGSLKSMMMTPKKLSASICLQWMCQ